METIEALARLRYERDWPRRRWAARSMPRYVRKFYLRRAEAWLRENFGDEARLIAFCRLVLDEAGNSEK